jgi:4-hydroxybenzoyl-CoA reductase subunit beta
MMRLPHFRYLAPRDVAEATSMLADDPNARLLAGGTDLLPNMKRRQQTPPTLVSLRGVTSMHSIENGAGLRIGGAVTLTDLSGDTRIHENYRALFQAAVQVATPPIRNLATIGGNLCLDTRCNYYDQNWEWRRSIGFCMKKDGETCWVAPASKRCLAVSSTDLAPALIALGARISLRSRTDGEREMPLADLYNNDGIDYQIRRPDEILAEVRLDPTNGWRSCYWKLRRRGSFDFPVLGVAAAIRLDKGGAVEDARLVLGAVASQPLVCARAANALIGKPLTDETIAAAGAAAGKQSKPMDNTDFTLHWRKRVVPDFVGYALRELRGDDMSAERLRTAQHLLVPPV